MRKAKVRRRKRRKLIESNPGVCGGAMCVLWRRIPVWMLWEAHKAGATNKQLLKDLPTLDRARLAAALR